MRIRPRDFIYTTDNLFFASTNYFHPKDRIISFLRYVPDTNGARTKNNIKYSKVDTMQAFSFLRKNYPEYLFNCDSNDGIMMGVPINKISKILYPNDRLNDILKLNPSDELLKKVIILANIFHDFANIPYDKMGVSGSILPDLYDPIKSDIDFVIYGLKNHRKAVDTFKEIKISKNPILKSIKCKYWVLLYKKRIKDDTLNYEEFKWYEKRKNNRGLIKGTLFDILATRDWDEIKGNYGEKTFKTLGNIEIEGIISDATASFDNPAIYKVENVKILEGPDVPITELASFTHTYAGQVKEGEEIIAKGKVEKVTNKNTKEIYNRLIVGTTRESINEYIKIKNLKIN